MFFVNVELLKKQIESRHKTIVSCEIQRLEHLPLFLGQLQLPNVRIITFIRRPLDHLFSSIMHVLLHKPNENPCRNFHEVIEAHENPRAQRCHHYRLINKQTAALSLSNDANVNEAIHFVSKNAFHFGITSLYRTSLCLLAYQLGQLSRNAKVCDCSLQSGTGVRHSNSHNTGINHSVVSSAKILSDDDLTILESKFINLDRVLYDVSLWLFLERVMIAEIDEGMSLLCASTDGEGVMLMKSSIRDPHWYGRFDEK